VRDLLLAGLRDGRPADGFARAIGECGRILAEKCPVQPGDTNELPNRLVLL
jgi:putative membrane protein